MPFKTASNYERFTLQASFNERQISDMRGVNHDATTGISDVPLIHVYISIFKSQQQFHFSVCVNKQTQMENSAAVTYTDYGASESIL